MGALTIHGELTDRAKLSRLLIVATVGLTSFALGVWTGSSFLRSANDAARRDSVADRPAVEGPESGDRALSGRAREPRTGAVRPSSAPTLTWDTPGLRQRSSFLDLEDSVEEWIPTIEESLGRDVYIGPSDCRSPPCLLPIALLVGEDQDWSAEDWGWLLARAQERSEFPLTGLAHVAETGETWAYLWLEAPFDQDEDDWLRYRESAHGRARQGLLARERQMYEDRGFTEEAVEVMMRTSPLHWIR